MNIHSVKLLAKELPEKYHPGSSETEREFVYTIGSEETKEKHGIADSIRIGSASLQSLTGEDRALLMSLVIDFHDDTVIMNKAIIRAFFKLRFRTRMVEDVQQYRIELKLFEENCLVNPPRFPGYERHITDWTPVEQTSQQNGHHDQIEKQITE